MTSVDPASIEPAGAPSPLLSDSETRSNPRRERRGRLTGGDGRVEDPRAVEIRRQPRLTSDRQGGGQRIGWKDDPARAVVGVLRDEQRGRRIDDVPARLDRRAHRIRVVDPGGTDRAELDAGIGGTGAGLVQDDVRVGRHENVVSGAGERPQRDLVGHRPARQEQRRLHAEQARDLVLESVDRWVLAVLVVTDLGLGDRPAHPLGRTGDRVGAQVDAVGHGADDRSPGSGDREGRAGPTRSRLLEHRRDLLAGR